MSSTSPSKKRRERAASADSDPVCRDAIAELVDNAFLPAACESPRPARRESQSGMFGGCKRRRSGGGMRSMGRPRASFPEDAALSCGLRFSTDPATPSQERNLAKIVKTYLQAKHAYDYRDYGADAISVSLGVSESAAEKLLCLVRDPDYLPFPLMAVDVLHGMFSGKIAGVLGTRKTKTTTALFASIFYDFSDYEFNRPTDRDFFQRAYAAFRIDFNEWRYRTRKSGR